MTGPRLSWLGDSCLSIEFEPRIDPDINAQCVALAADIDREALPGVRDVVPAFRSVAIHFDPLRMVRAHLEAVVGDLIARPPNPESEQEVPFQVPVEYGGLDLGAVAAFARCSEDDVVRIHTGRVYRVYMLGFLPGFAYMAPVDARIAMPRLETPRLRVEAGSVAIAGRQTGVYPFDSPGGWRIIGRSTMRVFDPGRHKPCVFRAGQRVQFIAA